VFDFRFGTRAFFQRRVSSSPRLLRVLRVSVVPIPPNSVTIGRPPPPPGRRRRRSAPPSQSPPPLRRGRRRAARRSRIRKSAPRRGSDL